MKTKKAIGSLYKKIASESNDPPVRLLFDLIVADEERHREIVGRMVAPLKDDLAWSGAPKASTGARRRPHKSDASIAIADRLVEGERKGIKDFENLSQIATGMRYDLFAPFCRTMVHDSLKHIGILEFLRHKLRAAHRPRRSAKK